MFVSHKETPKAIPAVEAFQEPKNIIDISERWFQLTKGLILAEYQFNQFTTSHREHGLLRDKLFTN